MMNPSPTAPIIKYVGLDVHAQTIAVAVAHPGGDVVSYGTVPAHSHSMDRLHKKLAADGAQVRYVYEAGSTGFWLARHLRGKKIPCERISHVIFFPRRWRASQNPVGPASYT